MSRAKHVDYPLVSMDPQQQADYLEMRAGGMGHACAEMLALQQPPGLHGTDSIFMAGSVNGKQFERAPWLGKAYKQISERLRPGCTSGAEYKSQLAKYAGDPDAWVKGTSDVKRAAAIKGVDVDGVSVSHKSSAVCEKAPVPLAPDILRRHASRMMAVNPTLSKQEAVEQALYKHTPRWKQKLIPEYLKSKRKKHANNVSR